MKRLGVFLLPLDGMLVHRRSLPRNLLGFPQQFAGTHLYTWVERGTVRVKCLAQEHNTMSPARARTQLANCFTKIHCWGAGSKMLAQAVQSEICIFWKEKGSGRSREILI